MISDDLLIKLEAAYHNKLSAEEMKALERSLATEPAWVVERQTYKQLWDGFAAKRAEDLREQIVGWEEELSENDDAELLEWYYQNQLSEDRSAHIRKRLQEDDNLAALYQSYQSIWDGAAAARGEAFREQLQNWEQKQVEMPQENNAKIIPIRRAWGRRIAVAIAACLVLAVGSVVWLRSQYSGQNLVAGYYQRPPLGGTLGGENTVEQYLEDFATAHRAFQASDYTASANSFMTLSKQIPPDDFAADDLKYYQDNIDWMVVLSGLGAEEETGDLLQRLSLIVNNPEHTYQAAAQSLQADLDKWWR